MNRILRLVLTILAIGTACGKELAMNANLSGKKVAIIIAFHDFRDEEFVQPFVRLTQAGARVTVASSRRGTAEGMLGKTIKVEYLVADLAATNFDAIVFVGGGGAQEYFDNPAAHQLARDALQQGKVVGAICVAPAILAHADLLKGKQVTGFPSILPDLRKAGATVNQTPVVRDGTLVTADGPQSATPFAAALIEALK